MRRCCHEAARYEANDERGGKAQQRHPDDEVARATLERRDAIPAHRVRRDEAAQHEPDRGGEQRDEERRDPGHQSAPLTSAIPSILSPCSDGRHLSPAKLHRARPSRECIPSERSESRDLHLGFHAETRTTAEHTENCLGQFRRAGSFTRSPRSNAPRTATTASARGGRGARRSDLSAGPLKAFGVVDGEEPCAGASIPTRKAVLRVLGSCSASPRETLRR